MHKRNKSRIQKQLILTLATITLTTITLTTIYIISEKNEDIKKDEYYIKFLKIKNKHKDNSKYVRLSKEIVRDGIITKSEFLLLISQSFKLENEIKKKQRIEELNKKIEIINDSQNH